MIFFTADTHFQHRNIIRHCSRPFDSVEEHDETLISNWNSVVSKRDIVYHLGDFGLAPPKKLYELSLRLNGRIHLLVGNHDRCTIHKDCRNRFESIRELYTLKCQDKGVNYQFVLCHYALRTWNKSHHGVPHLYGHSHGQLGFHENSLDVGVDCNSYTPLSPKQILEKIDELTSAYHDNEECY